MNGEQLALSIDANGAAGIEAKGATHIGVTNRSLNGALRGRIQSISRASEFLRIPNPTPLDGSLDWRVTLGGSVSRPRIAFTAGSTDLSLPAVKAVSLDLYGAYDASVIRLDCLRLRSGVQEILASGAVDAERSLQIEGTFKAISIGRLLEATGHDPSSTGNASGAFTLHGRLSNPQIQAQVSVGDLEVYGQPVGTLEESHMNRFRLDPRMVCQQAFNTFENGPHLPGCRVVT